MTYSLSPCSDSQVAVPASGSSLQISPNLEALLQHDEWSRRGTSSPTSLNHPSPQLSGFAVSLPPPPPRNRGRKAIFQEPRARDTHRQRSANVSTDSWPDALPVQVTADGSTGHSTPTSSRSATPNPYINPAPVLKTINNASRDASPTSQGFEQVRAYDGRSSPAQSVPEICRGLPAPDLHQHVLPSHRSSPALYKVEKILSRGRGSLSLFTGGASPSSSKTKRDQGGSSSRAERSNAEDETIRLRISTVPELEQVPESRRKRVSHQLSAFGADTATVASASSHLMSGSRSPRQPSSARPTENIDPSWPALSRPSSYSGSSNNSHSPDSASASSESDAHNHTSRTIYPHSSQYNTAHRSDSTYNIPRLPVVERMPSFHPESFMDLFTPSNSDPDSFLTHTQSVSSHISQSNLSFRHTSQMESSSLYSTSSANFSSETLESMIFAPPSPIVGSASGSGEPQSPIFAFPRADSPSASSVALSQMIFAPPSPTGPSNPSSPTYHQRFSSSSYASSLAPLEFAPPSPMSDIGKPPLPATPKPVFRRNEKPRFDKRSQSASPHPAFTKFAGPLPPTTNLLDANERADLIRRNRKLAQVFGQTPGAEMSVTDEDDEPRLFKILPQPALAAFLGLAKQRNHRHAMSVSVALKTPGHRTEPTSPWQVLDSPWSPGDRRYSTPLTPDSFTLYFDSTGTATDHHPYTASRSRDPQCHAGSQTSFIDLSDEDTPNDGASFISASGRLKKGERCHEFRYSTTAPSLAETLSPEAQFEAEKRRKRDKLAKLHRFLGSRVPTDLVVGAMAGPPLPPSLLIDTMLPEYGPRQAWMYRRRSGSALPSRSEPFDRVKQDLDGEEKALNVKRAHKMEKVFGTAPPQTLYHTRPLPSIPDQFRSVSPARVVSPSHTPTSPLPDRNRNQSAYTKLKGKRQDRPGTSESTKRLLSHSASISVSNVYGSGYQDVLARSSVYINYHQSLNSLIDIIDRDDRESLAELHRYLHGDVMDSPAEEEPRIDPRRASGSHSVRSERRHSLPTSMISISTEMTMPSAKPEATDFQLRRRRAAKLTNFFGVDYRELIDDVLESIEKGVEEERRRGTLEPEEVEVLLHKVQSLRRRDSFS